MWDSVAGWVAVDTSGCDPCPCVPPS
jgi:hypothetical protein